MSEDVLRQPLKAEETGITELERAAEETRQREIEKEMEKRQVSVPGIEADVGRYAGGYERFLEERIKSGKLESLTNAQKERLVKAYREFPFNKEVITRLGEKIIFRPLKGLTREEYIHHFLTKYSAEYDKEFYSDRYLALIREIPETIKNYDDRILGEKDGQERIYYIKKFDQGKQPEHVVIAVVDNNGNFIGWTHFEAKRNYVDRLKEREKDLVERLGLVDKEGNLFKGTYDEYLKEKNMRLFYLGNRRLEGDLQSQEPTRLPDLNIPQKGRVVKKGSGTEADTGGYQEGQGISAIELPELVELAVRINEGKYPKIMKKLRAAGGQALGQFKSNALKGSILLRADIFKGEQIRVGSSRKRSDFEIFKDEVIEDTGLPENELTFDIERDIKKKRWIFRAYRKDPTLAAKVLAHEIGHLVDWLPDKDLKRGDIFGRIASLEKYMKTMLEEFPESPNKILTPQERKKIRNRIQRQVAREFGGDIDRVIKDKDFRQRVLEEARKRYRKEIQRITEERGLYTKEEIMKELKALTQAWKPFDETADRRFTAYRYSAKELYADALSVLLNDPGLLKKTAPKFTKAFFSYLRENQR